MLKRCYCHGVYDEGYPRRSVGLKLKQIIPVLLIVVLVTGLLSACSPSPQKFGDNGYVIATRELSQPFEESCRKLAESLKGRSFELLNIRGPNAVLVLKYFTELDNYKRLRIDATGHELYDVACMNDAELRENLAYLEHFSGIDALELYLPIHIQSLPMLPQIQSLTMQIESEYVRDYSDKVSLNGMRDIFPSLDTLIIQHGVAMIANESLTATHVQRLTDFLMPLAEHGTLENVNLSESRTENHWWNFLCAIVIHLVYEMTETRGTKINNAPLEESDMYAIYMEYWGIDQELNLFVTQNLQDANERLTGGSPDRRSGAKLIFAIWDGRDTTNVSYFRDIHRTLGIADHIAIPENVILAHSAEDCEFIIYAYLTQSLVGQYTGGGGSGFRTNTMFQIIDLVTDTYYKPVIIGSREPPQQTTSSGNHYGGLDYDSVRMYIDDLFS